jgi:hypothetical protein
MGLKTPIPEPVEGIMPAGNVTLAGHVCDGIESPQPPFTKGGKKRRSKGPSRMGT